MKDDRKLHETRIARRGMKPAGVFAVEPMPCCDGVAVVAVSGELDLAATGALRARVDAAAGLRGLVLDLAEATFMDSAILQELLRAHAQLERYETQLVLAAVPPAVRRLLDLTRTFELFTVAEDRESALRALGA
jgi:anti-anti-sigma factor